MSLDNGVHPDADRRGRLRRFTCIAGRFGRVALARVESGQTLKPPGGAMSLRRTRASRYQRGTRFWKRHSMRSGAADFLCSLWQFILRTNP
jgi:hypothetical protein